MNQKNDNYIEVSKEATKHTLKEFKSILPKLNNKKILDIGCGVGLLMEQFSSNNTVIGIDNNHKSLKIVGKKKMNAKYHDLEKKLSFKENYFDLIICKDVLEYIFNSEQLLDEIIRITKKKGTILLHLPNEFTIIDLLEYIKGNGILKKRWFAHSNELTNPHIRFFTKKNLIEYLNKKNVKIIKDYSWKWNFSLPIFKIKLGFLSKISDRLFSSGITLIGIKNK